MSLKHYCRIIIISAASHCLRMWLMAPYVWLLTNEMEILAQQSIVYCLLHIGAIVIFLVVKWQNNILCSTSTTGIMVSRWTRVLLLKQMKPHKLALYYCSCWLFGCLIFKVKLVVAHLEFGSSSGHSSEETGLIPDLPIVIFSTTHCLVSPACGFVVH